QALTYSRDHPVPLAALSRLLRTGSGDGPLFDVCLNYLPGGPPQGQASGDLLMTSVDVKDEEPSACRWWDGTALIDYVLRSASPSEGPFDHGVLLAALRALAARHETLRMAFVPGQEGIRRAVWPTVEPRIHATDLACVADDERDRQLDTMILAQARQPTDLTR